MKKILYIYIGDIDHKSGVTNKLKGLFRSLENKAVLTVFALSSKMQDSEFRNVNYFLVPFKYNTDQKELYKQLGDFVKDKTFDTCIFRYPFPNQYFFKFLKRNKGTFIFEHNTKELPETKQQALHWIQKFNVSPSPSYVKLIFNAYVMPIFNESWYGRRSLRFAKKGIAVTGEIARYEKQRHPAYKCSVVSNGVDVGKSQLYFRELTENATLNLIMFASRNNEWHGVDFLIESFIKYNKTNIRLTLIGDIEEKFKKIASVNRNIEFTGYLTGQALEDYLRKAHVGLGSLALFRVDQEEASTLKVREYFASGLPVVLGYKDVDVEESTQLKKNTYAVDIRRQNIDWADIYKWAARLYQEKNLNEQIREAAFKQIDYSVKADQLLSL